MTNAEPTDYAAKLEQIFSRDSREGNFYIFASQISMIREAAALIRRQAEEIAKTVEDYEAELSRVHGLFDRMASILAYLEWSVRAEGMEDVDDNPYWNFCPMCARVKADGHSPDCRLKAALGA
jgi:hypothetical protein